MKCQFVICCAMLQLLLGSGGCVCADSIENSIESASSQRSPWNLLLTQNPTTWTSTDDPSLTLTLSKCVETDILIEGVGAYVLRSRTGKVEFVSIPDGTGACIVADMRIESRASNSNTYGSEAKLTYGSGDWACVVRTVGGSSDFVVMTVYLGSTERSVNSLMKLAR